MVPAHAFRSLRGVWVRTLSTQPTLLRRDGCSTAGPPAGRTDSRPGSSPYLNTPTIEAQTERNRLPAPALQRPPCSQLLWVRPCQKRPANGTTPYSPSCDLGSPGITSPRLLRGVACGWFPSFSGLRIPCLGIKGIVFVCSPPPPPPWTFGFFHGVSLVRIRLPGTQRCKYLLGTLVWCLWGDTQKRNCWTVRELYFRPFEDTPFFFPRVAAPIFVSRSHQRSRVRFLHILTTFVLFLSLFLFSFLFFCGVLELSLQVPYPCFKSSYLAFFFYYGLVCVPYIF